MAIKGIKNLTDPFLKPKADRLPMTIDLLKILGHRISKLEWNDFAKQVLWTACTTSFFSSCRMGEILSTSEKNFDPKTDLLWENVAFSDNKEVLIFIPFSKTTGFKGKFVDIYPIHKSPLCPSSSQNKLRKMAVSEGIWDPKKPVFTFKSGKFLTKLKLNFWLSNLLSDFTDMNHKITGHSFRAAIPTVIASHPDKCTVQEIQEWGGWATDCYHFYTKDKKRKGKSCSLKLLAVY